MHLTTHIIYRGDAKVQGREAKGIISRAMATAIEWWHRVSLPRHFDQDAGKRYHYGKRKKKYMMRKAREKGHQKPLVYTGDMKAHLIRGIRLNPLKTKAQASGRMRGPRYVHMKATSSKKHDLGKEVVQTTQNEANAVRRIVDRKSTNDFNRLKQTRSVAAA